MVADKGWMDVPGGKETEMSVSFFQRLKRHLSRMRMRPIRVFVFHQVSDVFEPETMWDCDWTQTDVFKRNICALMKEYTFISLEEVREHLTKDRLRYRKFAALTADDGWASLKSILPWLVDQKIPVTLFLNPSCLDGKHWNSRETDRLLTQDDVVQLVREGAPYISVASHGWTHKSCAKMTLEEFAESVRASEEVLDRMPAKVPFFAFASGEYTSAQMAFLRDRKLVPVLVDGLDNGKDPVTIHRFCMDMGENHE